MRQFIRFIAVGAANTGFGYVIIFACMYLADFSPEFSNLVGYMVGLVASYFFHRNYTFRSVQQRRTEFIRFIVVFVVAYCANLAVLTLLVRSVGIHAGISQIIAGVMYVLVAYLLNRSYVFRSNRIND